MPVLSYGQSSHDTLPVKFDSLKAAIVTATLRPHMKGDTVEYNIEHIRMRPNAVVEELLRRLPGLHIDPDGGISYNGEKIEHLLVDGEDIFGDNPSLVTRNFDASKIARVQILDRKSDQARFTGVDDGSRIKTLNLVMKVSEKDGYFGKIESGGSSEGYYNAAGVLAGFRDQEQITAIGFSSNTGSLGFSSNGKGSPTVGFLSGISDPLGASAGTGVPRFSGLAFHYSNRWSNPEEHLQTNYQYGNEWTNPVTKTQTQQRQPNTIFDQSQQSQSVNQQGQHTVHLAYEKNIGSRSALRVDMRGNIYQSQNRFDAVISSSFNDTLTNSNMRTIQDHSAGKSLSGDIFWRIHLGRQQDRLFAMTIGLSGTDNTTDGYLFSMNHYFQRVASIQQMDTTDQRKRIADRSQIFRGGMNYTQPILPGIVLAVGYGLSISNGQPEQYTYGRGDGKYNEPVDSLTDALRTQNVNQLAIVTLQGKTRHVSYSFGMKWLDYNYKQQDKISDSIIHQHYGNLAPVLSMNCSPKPTFNIGFQYSILNQQPAISQLTSIKNNSDPLHLIVGNPGLRPATSQVLAINFRWLKAWMISSSVNLSLNNNSIGTRTITDSIGRQVSQSLNVNGGRSAGLNFSVNHKIAGIDWGFQTFNTYTRTINFVNADISRNDVYTSGGGISATKYITEKFSFQINTNFTYFNSKSSINASTLHYWTQSHSALASFYFIRQYEFGANATYTWQEKTSSFAGNTSVLLWNAYASRNFLHDKLTIKALMNNVLDQNSGITRTNTGNTNTQTATNILGRYWMLSVTYHFDKKFKKK